VILRGEENGMSGGRPPFDPARRRARRPRTAAAADTGVLSVEQVNSLVAGALRQVLPPKLSVQGEIGNLSRPSSGHLYFALKDATSELRCVMWRSAAARLKFELEAGLEVVATGEIEVYKPRGSYQLMVSRIEPRGAGALELALRQLKEKLAAEGLFEPARKRPLPAIPERIAVVTSPSGAAIRDIVQTLRRRYPLGHVLLFPVRVQGAEAAGEIAAAIRTMNEHAARLGGIDVAIVGRGGGSLEDLWAFNEEIVARAIAASEIPIISAVGHEVDFPISDLVADLRAPTPTAAAELVAPAVEELRERVGLRVAAVTQQVGQALRVARLGFERLVQSAALQRPMTLVRARQQYLDEVVGRLGHALARRVHDVQARLRECEHRLERFRGGARYAEWRYRVERRVDRIRHALHERQAMARRALGEAERRLARATPARRVARARGEVAQRMVHLAQSERRLVRTLQRLLAARAARLEACDPRRVLQRGYSLTRDARTRKILRSVDEIRDKLRIVTELSDGTFQATADDPRQPGLFDEG
jgi:exodeoxyribonuclease VII large subunit